MSTPRSGTPRADFRRASRSNGTRAPPAPFAVPSAMGRPSLSRAPVAYKSSHVYPCVDVRPSPLRGQGLRQARPGGFQQLRRPSSRCRRAREGDTEAARSHRACVTWTSRGSRSRTWTSRAEIAGCRLTAATFTRVKLSAAFIQLSFLDRATFGSAISPRKHHQLRLRGFPRGNCPFEDCEIIQVNFLGIRGDAVSFDHSNLYGSRFIGSCWKGEHAGLQPHARVLRFSSQRSGDFHMSNTSEAPFIEEEP